MVRHAACGDSEDVAVHCVDAAADVAARAGDEACGDDAVDRFEDFDAFRFEAHVLCLTCHLRE